MGCGDNRDQPRPARSGRSVCWAGGCWMRLALVSVVWGSHEEEGHRSDEHFVAQHLASNACRRGLSSQARWAEESGVWSRLPRQGRVETGGLVLGNECLLLFPNLPLVHIAKSRFSHALPCRHTVEMGAGAWFEPLQAGSHCFGEGFSEGRFDVSSEISGRPAVKIPIWLWLLAKSDRRRVGVLSVVPTAVEARSGRVSGDARQDSPRRLVKGVHEKQRRWNWTKSANKFAGGTRPSSASNGAQIHFFYHGIAFPPPKRRDGHPHRQWTLTVGPWPTVWKIYMFSLDGRCG